MDMPEDESPELVILPRPQISVFVNKLGEVTIDVAEIDQSFKNIEITAVSIPMECVQQVAEAMLAILKRKS